MVTDRKLREDLIWRERDLEVVGPQAVRSTSGFEVAFVGRFELLYQEGSRRLIVPVEPLKDMDRVNLSQVEGWRPPHDKEELTADKREEIQRNISAALKRLRLGFEIG